MCLIPLSATWDVWLRKFNPSVNFLNSFKPGLPVLIEGGYLLLADVFEWILSTNQLYLCKRNLTFILCFVRHVFTYVRRRKSRFVRKAWTNYMQIYVKKQEGNAKATVENVARDFDLPRSFSPQLNLSCKHRLNLKCRLRSETQSDSCKLPWCMWSSKRAQKYHISVFVVEVIVTKSCGSTTHFHTLEWQLYMTVGSCTFAFSLLVRTYEKR